MPCFGAELEMPLEALDLLQNIVQCIANLRDWSNEKDFAGVGKDILGNICDWEKKLYDPAA